MNNNFSFKRYGDFCDNSGYGVNTDKSSREGGDLTTPFVSGHCVANVSSSFAKSQQKVSRKSKFESKDTGLRGRTSDEVCRKNHFYRDLLEFKSKHSDEAIELSVLDGEVHFKHLGHGTLLPKLGVIWVKRSTGPSADKERCKMDMEIKEVCFDFLSKSLLKYKLIDCYQVRFNGTGSVALEKLPTPCEIRL